MGLKCIKHVRYNVHAFSYLGSINLRVISTFRAPWADRKLKVKRAKPTQVYINKQRHRQVTLLLNSFHLNDFTHELRSVKNHVTYTT